MPGAEGDGRTQTRAKRDGVSFAGNIKTLKLIVVMDASSVNMLITTELHQMRAWHGMWIFLIKQLKNKRGN